MRTIRAERTSFENRHFVEPLAWTPFWHQRAKSTRDLAEQATDNQAKSLLLLIAETYERLARSQ